jgi:hypothetical protein
MKRQPPIPYAENRDGAYHGMREGNSRALCVWRFVNSLGEFQLAYEQSRIFLLDDYEALTSTSFASPSTWSVHFEPSTRRG